MNKVKAFRIRTITIALLACFHMPTDLDAKKIKNSFKVNKEIPNKQSAVPTIKGIEVSVSDSLPRLISDSLRNPLKNITFAGYDKEPNSNRESFIIINPTEKTITGYQVRIDYLDMKGRMLHSRIIKESCNVPGGESRRHNIPTWDLQHTYYYYLGNEPKRVATPFQVVFKPISFWVEEPEI